MRLAIGVAMGLMAAGVCNGQHADVQLQVTAGKLETGRIDFTRPGNPVDTAWRVFESDFDPASHFTDEPGFNATSTSGLPGNTLLGFTHLDGVRKWDAGAGAFGPVIPGAITVQLGPVGVSSPVGCNQNAEGFAFAQTNGSGAVHQHVQFLLNAPIGAGAGVYVLKLAVRAEAGGIEASEPFWIVFANDVSEDEHEAAAGFVRSLAAADACPADVNQDGVVSGADLSVLLAGFGGCVMNGSGADCNRDGRVSGADLSVVLASFGDGC